MSSGTSRLRRQPARPSLAAVAACALFLACAALLLLLLFAHVEPPWLHRHHPLGFFDLKVYRRAATVVHHGGNLYGAKFGRGLGFTYPPVAALLFLSLRTVPLQIAELAVGLANVTLVALVSHTSLRLAGGRAQSRRSTGTAAKHRWAAGWLVACVALWAEPVTTAIGYGQVDLLIAALVLVDLCFGRRSRLGGTLIGVAAALRLTPLIFIPYLAFALSRRMAARAAGTFALSVLLSFVLLPRDAITYWTGTLFDTSRITGGRHLIGAGPADQSLHGALMRLAPALAHQPTVWLGCCALTGAAGLWLAILAARHGDQVRGFTLCAITSLLVSPVSWTHHWVIAIPALLIVIAGGGRSLRRALLAVAGVALALGSHAIWIEVSAHPKGYDLSAGGLLLGDLYVIIALSAIIAAGVAELARRHRESPTPLVRSSALREIPQRRWGQARLALAAPGVENPPVDTA